MNTNKKIIIKEDYIEINEVKIYPPFLIEDFKAKLGDGEVKATKMKYAPEIFVWEEFGIQAFPNDEKTAFGCIEVCIKNGINIFTENPYDGIIKIGDKPYEEAKWKFDKKYALADEMDYGCFYLATVLKKNITKVKDDYMSYRIQIVYNEPEEKIENIYILNEVTEPVLKFESFGFKLAIVQSLMYDKELLTPRFDVYDFADVYEGRKIDVDKEGYEPIQEVVDWFKTLQIPATLADEITELIVDGGNEIYSQIIPFWDGEDDYFDIKNVSEEEIRQIKNLKSMEVMPQDNWDEMEIFKKCGIEVEEI
jgi:hypothetical protein